MVVGSLLSLVCHCQVVLVLPVAVLVLWVHIIGTSVIPPHEQLLMGLEVGGVLQ